jgi:hypothetical protein
MTCALLVFTPAACGEHTRANPMLVMCMSARQLLEPFVDDRVSVPAVDTEGGIALGSSAGAIGRA